MSNSLAIAAVTSTLRNLITRECDTDGPLSGTVITAKPPDKARDGVENSNQINIFLYQTAVNAAFQNVVPPGRGNNPLALNLHYLITAYGQDDNDVLAHQLLGSALRALHDTPALRRADIEAALADNDLHTQIEQARVTQLPLTVEDLSKLWMMFQTQYRISAAYEVSLVLIESRRPVVQPLPVLRRGPEDRGAEALLGPFPTLESIHVGEEPDDILRLRQPSYPSARAGVILTLRGANLGGESVLVRFVHSLLGAPIELPATQTGSAGEIKVTIPTAAPPDWVAGIYSVTVVVSSGGRTRTTNTLPLPFAPRITALVAGARTGGNVTVTVTCAPPVQPQQRAELALPDREVAAADRATATAQLEFLLVNPAAGEIPVRLRVDGVESWQFKRAGTPAQLVIDQQKVTIP